MKLTVDFENGMTITAKPETLQLINNGGQVVVVTRTADGAPVPLFSFTGQIATPEEIAARTVVKAEEAAPQKAAEVVEPTTEPVPAKKAAPRK